MNHGNGLSLGKSNIDAAPTIRVEIYNQTYNIRSDGDSDYISELAEYVDSRMREISSGTLTVDSLKVAILAALYIADELHRPQREAIAAVEVPVVDRQCFLEGHVVVAVEVDRDDVCVVVHHEVASDLVGGVRQPSRVLLVRGCD